MLTDPYQILGVSRSCSMEDIKKAFHKLAHKHHPDKGGDAEVFKSISAAYADLLKNHRPPSDPSVTVIFGDIHVYAPADFSAANAMSQEWVDNIVRQWAQTHQKQAQAEADRMARQAKMNEHWTKEQMEKLEKIRQMWKGQGL